MPERIVSREVNEAGRRSLADRVELFTARSRPMWVTFPSADSPRDIQHGLNAIPDGMVTLWQDATVIAVPGTAWTPTLAYLQSPTANSRALVVFVTLKESPINGG